MLSKLQNDHFKNILVSLKKNIDASDIEKEHDKIKNTLKVTDFFILDIGPSNKFELNFGFNAGRLMVQQTIPAYTKLDQLLSYNWLKIKKLSE